MNPLKKLAECDSRPSEYTYEALLVSGVFLIVLVGLEAIFFFGGFFLLTQSFESPLPLPWGVIVSFSLLLGLMLFVSLLYRLKSRSFKQGTRFIQEDLLEQYSSENTSEFTRNATRIPPYLTKHSTLPAEPKRCPSAIKRELIKHFSQVDDLDGEQRWMIIQYLLDINKPRRNLYHVDRLLESALEGINLDNLLTLPSQVGDDSEELNKTNDEL